MSYRQKVPLGQTGLLVSRLGIGCSYGIDTSSLIEAFEQGINYFYFGTLRRAAMAKAVHHLAPQYREKLVIAIQSYTRWAVVLRKSVAIALKKLKLEYADALILGKVDSTPSSELMKEALKLKKSGHVRFLIVSAHRRSQFQQHLQSGVFDAIMVRYNAAHVGAEKDVLPLLPQTGRPGVICYTATRWGTLLDQVPGEPRAAASDCYRFVLRNPYVDVCLCGPKNRAELIEALKTLDAPPIDEQEDAWMRRIGNVIYQQKHHNFVLRKLIFD